MVRYLLLAVNFIVVLLMALAPWAVLKREFGGVGVLLTPFDLVNPQNLQLPAMNTGWVTPFFWAWVLLVLVASAALFLPDARTRARVLYGAGAVGLLLFVAEAAVFYQTVNAVNGPALEAGTSPRRLPLRRFSLSLGAYMGVFFSLGMLILARLQLPGGKAFLVRYRGVVVPLVSLLLASLIGALVVGFIRPGLGAEGKVLPLLDAVATKLDLVTYTFQLLFSPVISVTGWFQSLLLATPLIFTGLAVAFGFRSGLFNIGAPGQLTVGAITAMLVGVYLPGPGWVTLPLSIAAAAAGGALWGAIPGWLKARFGAHEVINTIMLNYVAASLFLFLIAANEYKFFGTTVRLPFKAEGFEARSNEVQEGSRIPLMLDLLVRDGHLSWAIPLALVLGLVAYYTQRRMDLGRRLLISGGAVLAGYVVGGFLPGPSVELTSALTSSRFNGAFLLAVLALLFYNFYLFRTPGGYELRAVGLAPKAAEYGGVNLRSKTVLAMAISGALAGLAATHYVLGGGIDEYRLKQSLPTSVGFDGIAVALMGQNTPIGISLSALLFGVLLTGGLDLNQQLAVSRELVTVLQALIVLFIAAGGFLPRYFIDPLQAAQVETEARAELEAREKALVGRAG
ncbi:Branched-chain amino acid transport system / permease component [Calidithermus terrae]|uniref:Branched-chain amino acid transport system / permease component n=1 Tax=Calidithermus terrae TaxID=1408545 RepID=A0A399EG10_9DEIN|nr:ABC transporter permease [Calidithermus terrae]RIH81211.1 Branched-chain amino acid transport system / permease component [Calidithermus terrae]